MSPPPFWGARWILVLAAATGAVFLAFGPRVAHNGAGDALQTLVNRIAAKR